MVLAPFLEKLIGLVNSVDKEIAEWNEQGTCFVVKNDIEFKTLLKKYFKGNFTTFIRQLHFYGFKKIDIEKTVPNSNGVIVNLWGFKHTQGLFVRGKLDLAKEIKRKTNTNEEKEKLVSKDEVNELKCQVSFLQSVVEDMRQQMNAIKGLKVVSVKKEPEMPAPAPLVKQESSYSLKQDFKKRQRTKSPLKIEPSLTVKSEPEIDFPIFDDDMVQEFKTPHGILDVDPLFRSNSLSSLNSAGAMSGDDESFSELFSDLELEPVDPFRDTAWDRLEKSQNAVHVISKATNVKESDVSKIVDFLSGLTLNPKSKLPLAMKTSKDDMVRNAFDADLKPLLVQKVGVN